MKCKFLRSQLVKVKIFAAAGEFCKWCKSCFKIEAHHIFGQVAWELSKEDCCSRYVGSSVTAAKVIPRVCYNKSKLIKIFGTPQVLKIRTLLEAVHLVL